MDRQFWLGFIGSLLLGFGVFAPILHLPIVGNVSYFNNGKGDGIIILVAAFAALILTIAKEYKLLSIIGAFSITVLLYTFLNIWTEWNKLSQTIDTNLSGNPFKGLAELAIQSVQLEWGWAVMLIGAACLITVPIIRTPDEIEFDDEEDGRTACLYCAERIMIDAEICRYCGRKQPSDALPESLECQSCGIELELNITERKARIYSCDECGSITDLRGQS